MPYIDTKHRKELDPHIDRLAKAIKKVSAKQKNNSAFSGFLNYTCTRLALKIIPERRYWVIALVVGVFKNVGDEFYRRFGVPYEDEQIEKSGDVYPK